MAWNKDVQTGPLQRTPDLPDVAGAAPDLDDNPTVQSDAGVQAGGIIITRLDVGALEDVVVRTEQIQAVMRHQENSLSPKAKK